MPRDSDATSPVRRRSNGVRTRARIIAAAERHFATSGFRDTCLGDIAVDVGIRRASIAYHFSSKVELYAAVIETMKTPDVQQRLANGGVEVVTSAPGEFTKFVAKETERWGKAVREAGATAE